MTDLTSKGFPVHTEASAPEAAREMLAASRAEYGAVPNLHAIMAESPATLAAYRQLWALMDESGFSAAETQVISLTSNYENACRYCMAGHSVLARGSGLTDRQVADLRGGRPLDDPRLEALRRFTARVVTARGWVGEDETSAFLEAGFTRAHVLDVVLGVATKVLSNYVNHLADTPLDGFMAETVWAPPADAVAA